MNATSLYVSTCRLVLQAKVDDTSTWQDLYKIFPSLRQSLSCSICGNLLIEPYTPTESHCQHHVCKSCKGGRKKLRSTCSWCKDYNKYFENVQLRTLLQCYKKLCQYISCSQIYRSLSASPSGSNANNTSDNNKTLSEIIKEGTGFKDDFKLDSDMLNSCLISLSLKSASTQTVNVGKNNKGNPVENGGSTYSVISTNNGNRLTFKRKAKELKEAAQRNGEAEKGVKVNKVRKRSVFTTPPSCKCGQNTSTKGCCSGYKCPCYTADKPCCSNCGCVACKNPRGTAPPKEEDVKIKVENMESTSSA